MSGYKNVSEAQVFDKNGVPMYGMDVELHQKKMAKYDPEKEAIVRKWIEDYVGQSLDGDLDEALKSGVILCKLVNKLKPGSVGKVNTSKMPFMQMENINNFLKAAENLGLQQHDSFRTVDLYEAKNMPSVINALFMLASLAQKLPSYNGPKIGLKIADKNKIEWTEEQLRQARNTTSQQNAGAVKTGLEFQRSISREVVKSDLKSDNTSTSQQTGGSVKIDSQRSIKHEVVKVRDTGDTTVSSQQSGGTIKYENSKSISNEVVKVPQSAPSGGSANSSSSTIADLEKLAELRDKGILTEEEFQAKKKQILGL